MGTHYSLAQNRKRLKSWTKQCLPHLKKYLGDTTPVFCYQGMSGVAHATALYLAYPSKLPCDMLYIRKPGEVSHGSDTEYDLDFKNKSPRTFVFVDDLIDSGNTFMRVAKRSKNMREEFVVWNDTYIVITKYQIFKYSGFNSDTFDIFEPDYFISAHEFEEV